MYIKLRQDGCLCVFSDDYQKLLISYGAIDSERKDARQMVITIIEVVCGKG